MDIAHPTPLLGGLTPRRFMRLHWQKKPLLVRQALPQAVPPLPRQALFELVSSDAVESRLVEQTARGWRLRHGPFARRSLPSPKRPGWTLLVQGLDQHVDAARQLLDRFRFIPDARLDDLMLSYASDQGGVGPHVDSYDVFLLQVAGRRRWRIGFQSDRSLRADLPLKILERFEPECEWLLDTGDMLYLPPGWAHDGVAEGECMTCSIGFRASGRRAFAQELLQALADRFDDDGDDQPRLYADPRQAATAEPALIPPALKAFAWRALNDALGDAHAIDCAIGEVLSAPKAGVFFERPAALAGRADSGSAGIAVDRRSRMLYDDRHLFINGESFRIGGRDAALLRALADRRSLSARDAARLSVAALGVIDEWVEAGWLHWQQGAR